MRTSRTLIAALMAFTGFSSLGCSHLGTDAESTTAVSEAISDENVCSVADVAWDDAVTPVPASQRACPGPWEYHRHVTPCWAQRSDDEACPALTDANHNVVHHNYPDKCVDFNACNRVVPIEKTLDVKPIKLVWETSYYPFGHKDDMHVLWLSDASEVKPLVEAACQSEAIAAVAPGGVVMSERLAALPPYIAREQAEKSPPVLAYTSVWICPGVGTITQDKSGAILERPTGDACRPITDSDYLDFDVCKQSAIDMCNEQNGGVFDCCPSSWIQTGPIWVGKYQGQQLRCVATYTNYPTSTYESAHINYRPNGTTAATADNDPCPLARAPYECQDYSSPLRHVPCRQESFGADSDPAACDLGADGVPASGIADDIYYSAPNLTLAQLHAGDPSAMVEPSSVVPPKCLTGEDMSMKTPAQAQAKQAALLARIATVSSIGYPAPVDNTALLQKLVLNAKLTFEMVGGSLSGAPGDVVFDGKEKKQIPAHDDAFGDQISASLGLYTRYSAAKYVPACGHNPAPPDTTTCDLSKYTVIAPLNAAVAMCERLRSVHASRGVRAREQVYQTCLGLADRIRKTHDRMLAHGELDDATSAGTASDVCQFKQYRERFNETVSMPLREMLATPVDPRTPDGLDIAARRLAAIDAWFVALESLYPGAALDDARWTYTGEMVAAFWRGMYRDLAPLGDPYAPPASELNPTPPPSDAGADASDAGVASRPTIDADAISIAAHNELDADRSLLMQLFTPWASEIARQRGDTLKPPMTHAPLLYVMADAFASFHQRLNDLAIYHDVGCAYLGCLGQDTYSSEAARLWRVLALLPDQARLAKDVEVDGILRDETGALVTRAPWLDVFRAISQHHDAFDSALADAYSTRNQGAASADGGAVDGGGGDGATADSAAPSRPVVSPFAGATLTALPRPVVPIVSLVRDASSKAQAYEGSGLLLGPADHLRAGASEEYLSGRRQNLDTWTKALDVDVKGYKDTMKQLAGAALQQLDYDTLKWRTGVSLTQTLKDIDTLEGQQAALRSAIESAEGAFATHMQGYAKLAKIDPASLVHADAVAEMSIGASATTRTLVANLTAGEVLQLETSGQYAPTCAIAQAPALALPGLAVPSKIGTAKPLTGPEGYMLQLQGSEYQTQSHADALSQQSTTTTARTLAACAGIKANLHWSTPDAIGWLFGATASIDAYTYIETCAKADSSFGTSASSADQSQNGADAHVSASFAAGLRLPNTPYPDLPVGALLLVTTPTGVATATKDIRVVESPYTSFVADSGVDAYLVVNDLTSTHCTIDDTHKLAVKGAVLQHRKGAVTALEPAITAAIQFIEAQRPAIVKQGRLLPQQAASLRASALQTITDAGVDLGTLPAPVTGFLESWMTAVLSRIELEIEHERVSLELAGKRLAVRGATEEQHNAGEQGRIATLLGNWALRDLDAEAIRDNGRLVADTLLNEMYPVILLRDRALFATLMSQNDFKNALVALIRTPWDDPVDKIGAALVKASTRVLTGLADLEGPSPGQGTKPDLILDVVIEIPKPGKDPSGSWFTVDNGRAAEFWDGVLCRTTPTTQCARPDHNGAITLLPKDLYRLGGGKGIPCSYETPVIRDMALVLSGVDGTSATNENLTPQVAQVTTSAAMLFPTGAISGSDPTGQEKIFYNAGGPLTLDVLDPAWRAPAPRLLFLAAATGADDLYTGKRPDGPANNAARGLSPFATFSFNLSELWNPITPPSPDVNNVLPGDEATGAEIVFRIEARSVGAEGSLSWIRSCKN